MRTIAIIPARGGSRGIPRKNLSDLGGIPLITWSIRVAQEAERISRVIVSTDDEEIAEIAKSAGAEVPFLRPKSLSDDKTGLTPVIDHVVSSLKAEDYAFDAYLVLYPTQPFRTPKMLDHATELLERKCFFLSTMNVSSIDLGFWIGEHTEGWKPIAPQGPKDPETLFSNSGTLIGRSFYPDGFLSPTGAVTSVLTSKFIKNGDLRFCSGTKYFTIDNPVSSMDIDYQKDLEAARKAIQDNIIPWRPAELRNGEQQRAVQFSKEEGPGLTSCVYLVAPIRDNAVIQEEAISLQLNSLGTPYELRNYIDASTPFSKQKVILYESSQSPEESIVSSSSPQLLVEAQSSFPIRGSKLFQRLDCSYVPLTEEAKEKLEGGCGNVTSRFDAEIVKLCLADEPLLGDRVHIRIHGKDAKPTQHAGLCTYDGVKWNQKVPIYKYRHLSPLSVEGIGTVLSFKRTDDMSYANVIWTRQVDMECSAAEESEPFVLPGWTEFDVENQSLVNSISGEKITGRQFYPDVRRWIGLAYLPECVASEVTWSIQESVAPDKKRVYKSQNKLEASLDCNQS